LAGCLAQWDIDGEINGIEAPAGVAFKATWNKMSHHDEFRPTNQAAKSCRRQTGAEYFGRLHPELEAKLASVEGIGVLADFKKKIFLLPLWCGAGIGGYLRGIRKSRAAHIATQREAEKWCEMIWALQTRWCRYAYPSAYIGDSWGWHGVPTGKPSDGRSEWDIEAWAGEAGFRWQR
jgi:hypothetical protein